MSCHCSGEASSNEDAFVGVWELLPDRSKYQFGYPPRSGLYSIRRENDEYHITMEWVSSEGEEHNMSYVGIPDGVDYAYANPAIADTVSMTRVDSQILDSTTKKDGKVFAHARRVLSADQKTMTVIQSSFTPHGRAYSNASVYRRQE
jgi:hypothetical protein